MTLLLVGRCIYEIHFLLLLPLRFPRYPTSTDLTPFRVAHNASFPMYSELLIKPNKDLLVIYSRQCKGEVGYGM